MLKKLLLSVVLVTSMCAHAKPEISVETCTALSVAAVNSKGWSNGKQPLEPVLADIEKDTEMSNSMKSDLSAVLRYGYNFPDERTVKELVDDIVAFCQMPRT